MRFTRVLVVLIVASGCSQSPAPAPPAPVSVVEASIADLQAAMREGRTTSREIVTHYLTRIATYEDRMNGVIQVNPRALADAEARDQERAQGKIRGPLHGIPIALKDNVNTSFMPTTGGALAFDGLVPPYDATLARNLIDAGAVIIAKTTMTELANWVANGMPGNYSGLEGFSFNPYDPRRDPRGPGSVTAPVAAAPRPTAPPRFDDGRPVLGTGGSSSGTGTAASFWVANVGTETSGSILSPANQNMLAGIKPTVGRISRYGVIPITADQDTAGPMARTVADAAVLLGALESGSPDPNDPATTACQAPPNRDYTPHLKADALKGARIGLPKAFFFDPVTPPGEKEPRGGLNPAQRTAMDEAIAVLKQAGAEIVEADIPSIVDPDPKNNFLLWGTCAGPNDVRGKDANCSSALKYGMKRDFNAWLASLGDRAPVKTLTELREWNLAHANMGAIKYGQAQLDVSDEVDLERDRAKWEADRKKDIHLGATHGIDAMLKANRLDAILFPGASGAGIAAKPGYPTVIVPFATIPNNPPNSTFPGGFDPRPAPYGVSFTGTACSEPRLIELAYAFEQLTKKRVPPSSTP